VFVEPFSHSRIPAISDEKSTVAGSFMVTVCILFPGPQRPGKERRWGWGTSPTPLPLGSVRHP